MPSELRWTAPRALWARHDQPSRFSQQPPPLCLPWSRDSLLPGFNRARLSAAVPELIVRRPSSLFKP